MFGGIQSQYKTYDMKNPECKQDSRVQRPDTSLGQVLMRILTEAATKQLNSLNRSSMTSATDSI